MDFFVAARPLSHISPWYSLFLRLCILAVVGRALARQGISFGVMRFLGPKSFSRFSLYLTLVIALLAPASQAQRVSAKPNQGD
jgi:hypothetical protein